jgi:hypothetical protein
MDASLPLAISSHPWYYMEIPPKPTSAVLSLTHAVTVVDKPVNSTSLLTTPALAKISFLTAFGSDNFILDYANTLTLLYYDSFM